MDQSKRAIIEAFMEASGRHDMGAVAGMLHDEMVMEWPQSGERFAGRANAIGAMRAQEVEPEVAGEVRIVGDGDLWVAMMPLRYGEDVYHYVGVLELDGNQIRHGTGYFGSPFPSQPYRAEFADKG